MTYEVISLRRADNDVRLIIQWIAERSPLGAEHWLDAYEQMIRRLAHNPDLCEAALEAAEIGLPLKQALFGTPGGRKYRAVYIVAGRQVRILRIRGPGQLPLGSDKLV